MLLSPTRAAFVYDNKFRPWSTTDRRPPPHSCTPSKRARNQHVSNTNPQISMLELFCLYRTQLQYVWPTVFWGPNQLTQWRILGGHYRGCILSCGLMCQKIPPRSWHFSIFSTRKPCCRKETARCRKCSFLLKFANNIQYKYKTSQASKAATLQRSKHADA